MVQLYRELYGEILLLILLGWALISIPLFFNLHSVSLDIIGSDWDNEVAVYGTSMTPSLEDGEFVCVNTVDPSLVEASQEGGDIIAFYRPQQPLPVSPQIIVHRAINKTFREDLYFFSTKGDNNDRADFWNDTRGEEYSWNGMISQNLLIGRVVGVRKTYALEWPVTVMGATLAVVIVVDLVGYFGFTRRKQRLKPAEKSR